MDKQWVIAIDGPSGSGKSTCAKLLAKRLDVLYIDTGAMYRGLAYWANHNEIAFEEGKELDKFLHDLNLEYGVDENILIRINGVDLTEKIRKHEVSKLASIISQISSVRDFLVNFQRTLATTKVCVMEGRDIGSVVFPEAFCKFFITTSTKERARRRLEELKEKGPCTLSLEQITKDIEERDQTDRDREHSPLIQTEDAFLIENGTCLEDTIQELMDKAIEKAREWEIPL